MQCHPSWRRLSRPRSCRGCAKPGARRRLMSVSERQKQFEGAIAALPTTQPGARIAANFGFSNSARVIEGGLFTCTNNLETYSANLAAGGKATGQFIFLCVLTFPPQDEVYFAIVVTEDAAKVNAGLLKLFNEGQE